MLRGLTKTPLLTLPDPVDGPPIATDLKVRETQKPLFIVFEGIIGGARRDRTADLVNAIHGLHDVS